MGVAVAYKDSPNPADWLMGAYFTMYASVGLLWHSRDLHLGSLHVALWALVCITACTEVHRVSEASSVWSPDGLWHVLSRVQACLLCACISVS